MKKDNDNILAQSKLEQECYSEDNFYTKSAFLGCFLLYNITDISSLAS